MDHVAPNSTFGRLCPAFLHSSAFAWEWLWVAFARAFRRRNAFHDSAPGQTNCGMELCRRIEGLAHFRDYFAEFAVELLIDFLKAADQAGVNGVGEDDGEVNLAAG